MPNARAPNAPWVEVWLSPQTTVMPGLGEAELRADDVHDALLGVAHRVEPDAELVAVAPQRLDLGQADRVGDRPGRRGDVVVLGRQREVGAAHRTAGEAQPVEGLRARHLVEEVEVDVEQVRLALTTTHDVCVPHLLCQGPAHGQHLHETGPGRRRVQVMGDVAPSEVRTPLRTRGTCVSRLGTAVSRHGQHQRGRRSRQGRHRLERPRSRPLHPRPARHGHRPGPPDGPPARGGPRAPPPRRARHAGTLRPRPAPRRARRRRRRGPPARRRRARSSAPCATTPTRAPSSSAGRASTASASRPPSARWACATPSRSARA